MDGGGPVAPPSPCCSAAWVPPAPTSVLPCPQYDARMVPYVEAAQSLLQTPGLPPSLDSPIHLAVLRKRKRKELMDAVSAVKVGGRGQQEGRGERGRGAVAPASWVFPTCKCKGQP